MNNPRNLALAAVGVGAVLYFAPINFFRTPAVKAVEDRYSAGGGTDRHMPGTSTPRGQPGNKTVDQIHLPESAGRGAGTKEFRERIAEQQADQGSGPFNNKAFNDAMKAK